MTRLSVGSSKETRKSVIHALQKLSPLVKDRAKHISVITIPAVLKLWTHLALPNIMIKEIQNLNHLEPEPLNNDKGKVTLKGKKG